MKLYPIKKIPKYLGYFTIEIRAPILAGAFTLCEEAKHCQSLVLGNLNTTPTRPCQWTITTDELMMKHLIIINNLAFII